MKALASKVKQWFDPDPAGIVLGADHAGFALKETIRKHLERRKEVIHDLSPTRVPGDDYPVAAKNIANRVARSKGTLAILTCGTGLGMDIAANRVKGVRAVVVRNVEEAKLSREHNHANVLVLGGWITKPAEANRIVDAWLNTKPSNATRHVRRVKQLDA
jgi:ribose 5-phosphate isomerase B